MTYDLNEMIKECEAKKKENEKVCFAIGAGRILPKPGMKKAMRKALYYIEGLKGFQGFHPVDLWHTALIFDTKQNAIIGKNKMVAKGIQVGNVVPVLIEKRYLKEVEE